MELLPYVERNYKPILEVLKLYLTPNTRLLEIGSGNGQHAYLFAKEFKDLYWVTSDRKSEHAQIKMVLKYAHNQGVKNISGPIDLEIGVDDINEKPFDYVFTANTLHIMEWKENKMLFKLLGKRLREGALTFLYGPFNYNGDFTSESNRNFDLWLKERNLKSGIRHFEDVCQGMQKAGFKLLKDHEMPANNRILVFEKLPFITKK